MNIVDPILFHCRWQPLAPAVCAPGTKLNAVTYGRLEQFIHNVGRNAREHGLKRHDVVALFIRDPILHIAFILGLAKLGVVTVSRRELELPKELHVDALLADASYPADASQPAVRVDETWLNGPGTPSDETARTATSPDDPCRIILTSGSTGDAKAVARASKHVFARVHGLQTVYGSRLPDCARIFVDMGLSTGIGFTFLMYTLSRGGTLFMRTDKVIETLEALAAYRVQAIVASPKGLGEIAELCDRVPAFPGGLDVVISSGSQLTRTLSERVRSRLCTNLVSAYGSTEAGVVAAAPASAMARTEGAVGYVVPGVTVDVVDPSGAKLPPGKEGLLRIGGDCVVDGYVGDPENTRLMFRDGGFYPGDVGAVTSNGVLVISGREQAVINLGGDKVNPERVEAAVTSFAGVRDAGAFTAMTPVGVSLLGSAVVWRGEADLSGLQEHLHQHLPPVFIPKLFVAVESIPRNASGKIDRARLKEVAAQRANGQ